MSTSSSLAMGAVAGALAAAGVTRQLSFNKDSPRSVSGGFAQPGGRPGSAPQGNGKNVGILAAEAYTPSTFVSQSSLEEHSGVSAGRYTIGLGQDGLGLCGDCEDELGKKKPRMHCAEPATTAPHDT